jgi:hypothetical protein
MMKMGPHNSKELVAEIVQKLDVVNTELTACKLSFSALKTQFSELENRLGAASRSFAQLQRATHEKYDIPTERSVERFEEATPDWFFLQRWLQAVKASGRVN